MGAERLLEYWEHREEAIAREKEDPYNFGVELDHWKLVDDQLKDYSGSFSTRRQPSPQGKANMQPNESYKPSLKIPEPTSGA